MDVIITGRNLEVTDWIRNYVNKKIGKLSRYLPEAREARVELTREKTRDATARETVQVTIWANGSILRAEERSADLFAAVDAVADKMERQIERFKGKRRRRRQQGTPAAAFPESLRMEEEEETVSGPEIVRVKQFPVSPMSVEEAIDQMELLGHDFFVFYNADANGINVVYRRKDGNYGLLQPELA